MKWKKTALVLASCLLFSGCTDTAQSDSETQTQTPEASPVSTAETDSAYAVPDEIIPKETVTLDVYSQLNNDGGEQEGWFAQEMLNRFNVKLNFVNDRDEDMFAKLAPTGDLGDIIIFGTDTDQYHSAIDQGLLLDWEQNDLLSNYGSYIQENMPKALEKNRNNSDGHIYGFGHDVASDSGELADFDYHPDLRWDLYKQIGSPEISTLEDYVDVLKQMKEVCPKSDSGEETYGVSLFSDWDGDMMMFAKSTCTNFFGVDELGVGLYDVDTGAFQGCLDDGGYYLRVLKFYNQLYQNGLLDPDSRDQGYDGCIEDYQDGRAFFCIFGWLAAPQYNTVEHTADGKIMMPVAAADQKTTVNGLNPNGSNRVWTIGSKCEYPELAMAIINWLCTPEGRMISEYGPKGVCWDYDQDGNACMLETGYEGKNGDDVEMPENSGYFGTYSEGCPQFNNTTWALNSINPDSNGQPYNYVYWPNVESKKVSAIEQDWRDTTGAATAKDYLMKFAYAVAKPNTYTSSNKSEELGEKWEKVTECIRDGSWNAVYAESDTEFDQIIAQMQADANAAGYADCVAWCQQEAAARKASEE